MEATTFVPNSEVLVLGMMSKPEQAACERCGCGFLRFSRFVRICDGCRSNDQPLDFFRACA